MTSLQNTRERDAESGLLPGKRTSTAGERGEERGGEGEGRRERGEEREKGI